jgi:type III restriction enzyme
MNTVGKPGQLGGSIRYVVSNPSGSTRHVRFNTSRTDRWQTSPDRCHINWIILESDWEAEFCRAAESHPRVKAYVKRV